MDFGDVPEQSLGRVSEVRAGSGYRLKITGGHDGVVVGAAVDGFDDVPAVAVQQLDWRSVGVGFPSVSPLHEGDDGCDEVQSFFGEPVFVSFPLSGLTVGHPAQ